MITVGINGYGTIGKRVADAVRSQDDMTVAGVAKRSPNHEAGTAVDLGYPLYAADPDRIDEFEAASLPAAGTVEDLLAESDVVVDATPSGVGEQYQAVYEDYGVRAVYQGGEDADLADASFNARSNFDAARDADSARVVSCNTTGLGRLFSALDESFGVREANVTIVRRGGDPGQTDRGPINDIVPDPITIPSHHGPDVQTIIPDLPVETMGIKVPATLMHLQCVGVHLDAEPDRSAVVDALDAEPRISLLPAELDIDCCGQLREYARDIGRPRGDLWENAIWKESISLDGDRLHLFQAIHQESIVVPENVDAIRAVTASTDADASRAKTNRTLGIGT